MSTVFDVLFSKSKSNSLNKESSSTDCPPPNGDNLKNTLHLNQSVKYTHKSQLCNQWQSSLCPSVPSSAD